MQLAPTIYGLTEIAKAKNLSALDREAHLQYVYALARKLNSAFHRTPEWVENNKTLSKEFLFFEDGSMLLVTLTVEEKPIKFEPYIRD